MFFLLNKENSRSCYCSWPLMRQRLLKQREFLVSTLFPMFTFWEAFWTHEKFWPVYANKTKICVEVPQDNVFACPFLSSCSACLILQFGRSLSNKENFSFRLSLMRFKKYFDLRKCIGPFTLVKRKKKKKRLQTHHNIFLILKLSCLRNILPLVARQLNRGCWRLL